MPGNTVAVTEQDTNHHSRGESSGGNQSFLPSVGCVPLGVERGQHAERGWELQVPLPEARDMAALLARAQHTRPRSSLQPWPQQGEDVHEGHPDKHRNTPCMQETTGVDKRPILPQRCLWCCQGVGSWKGPRGARGARPGECCGAGGQVCRLI